MNSSTPTPCTADTAWTPPNRLRIPHVSPIRRFALVPILAISVAGATMGGTALSDDRMGGSADHPNVIRLYGLANFDAEVYVRANGDPPPTSPNDVAAAGDVTILEDQLFALKPRTNQPAGDQLGTSNGQCTFIAVDEPSLTSLRADALCEGVVTLPRGTITVEGLVTIDFTKTARDVFAITGGTGAYTGAQGTAIVTGLPPQGDSESALYEFRFAH